MLRWEEVEVGEPGPASFGCATAPSASTTLMSITAPVCIPCRRCPGRWVWKARDRWRRWARCDRNSKPGDRIAYASPPVGAYAEVRLIPADRVVALPDAIDDRTAAAMMPRHDRAIPVAAHLPGATR